MTELTNKLTNTGGVDKAIEQMSFLMGFYESTYGQVDAVVSSDSANSYHVCRVCSDLSLLLPTIRTVIGEKLHASLPRKMLHLIIGWKIDPSRVGEIEAALPHLARPPRARRILHAEAQGNSRRAGVGWGRGAHLPVVDVRRQRNRGEQRPRISEPISEISEQ